jgi:hypothetical protein
MTLPFPWPIYGKLTDSGGTPISGATILASGGNGHITTTTNNDGDYAVNMMNDADDSDEITVTSDWLGEGYTGLVTVNVVHPGNNLDITLEEAQVAGNIYINTNRAYGKNVYIFTPIDNKQAWCKTGDYKYG